MGLRDSGRKGIGSGGAILLRGLAVMRGEVGEGSFKMRDKNIFICWWDKFSKREIGNKGGSREVLR